MPPQLEIEFCRIGSPTEMWGTFHGMRWEFWAKYGNWEFRLSANEATLPELMAPADPGMIINGTFGQGPELFRSMEREEAEAIVRNCLAQYWPGPFSNVLGA
jgi:hypothetical protein